MRDAYKKYVGSIVPTLVDEDDQVHQSIVERIVHWQHTTLRIYVRVSEFQLDRGGKVNYDFESRKTRHIYENQSLV